MGMDHVPQSPQPVAGGQKRPTLQHFVTVSSSVLQRSARNNQDARPPADWSTWPPPIILDVLYGSSLMAKDQSAAPQAEELSPSELRVLRYLPTNLSRPEIASELSVSVNTVNTHVRNIYAKLQARDRSSAVQRARELRLLSAGRTR